MLATRFTGGLRARPFESRPDRDADIIWFVTDLHSAKEYKIESENDIGLEFIDANANAYQLLRQLTGGAAAVPLRADAKVAERRG
jgi:hypothetical protein